MGEGRIERVKALFDQAVDLPPHQQQALLDAACSGDSELRAAVEKLLADDARLHTDESAASFLNSPLVRFPPKSSRGEGSPASADASPLPARIGRYRILRLLGEGGMGTVYEAEQDNPRRPVALKVIRHGLVSPALRKRFAHEVQILGRLHHPGIAQIYEAGLGEDGRPFFALEFIPGQPLTEYVRRHQLDPAARLALAARVCDAVQYAHERGVIHRDLKPGNILVDETGQPKIIDFGVARATDADVWTTTGRSEMGQLLGTLSYMSPEQVMGDPSEIDQRSDVYSLGVILFELLSERLPYNLENLPLLEVAHVIREREPSRLGSIHSVFRGDVETIVGKALEKDRTRRYASAGELASDIRRHLNNEPIRARPPSALYHLRKFARRNKGLVGGVVGVFAALLLGTIVSVLFALRAVQNEQLANEEKREATYQSYRARLAAAGLALQNHDVVDASRQLEAAPEALRGWEWRHLRSRLDDSSSVIPLPAGGSGILIPGPNRLRIGIVTGDGLRLTDLDGGGPVTVPIRAKNPDTVIAAETRRGLRVAVSQEGAFELFDEAGQRLCRVETPGDTQPRVAVSPDGARLAWVRNDGAWTRLMLYDATTGKPTVTCEGHRGEIWAFAFSPDGKRLVSGGEDQIARLWDPATGALLATCRGHTNRILGVTFTPDGTRLLTTSEDGTARQWDVTTGREVELPYDRHTNAVSAAVYSPDGQWVASAGCERTFRIWRAAGRQDAAVLHGHTGMAIDIAFSPDGRRLASLSRSSALDFAGSVDHTVRVWEVDSQATLPVLRGHTDIVYPVAFSPDGLWIASGAWDSTVRLWDAATGEQCAELPHPGKVHGLAFGPGGSWLVTACMADNRLRIWDMTTVGIRKEIELPAGKLRSVTVRPDGRRMAASAYLEEDKVHHLHVFDVESGTRLFSAEGSVRAYSPDGRWLAVVNAEENILVLLDAQTHETAAQFRGHEEHIHFAAFSPDSRRLATCGCDCTVCLWQIDGGACQVLRGHTDDVFAVAFHPDSTRLASAGLDRAVWLWDLARGEDVARLQGHTRRVFSLAFSPDGATLASGSSDNTVRLWDTAPLKTRYQARREVEALRPEAERLVDRLFREKKEVPFVVRTLREDRELSEPLRRAAWRALQRRNQSVAKGPPGDPGPQKK